MGRPTWPRHEAITFSPSLQLALPRNWFMSDCRVALFPGSTPQRFIVPLGHEANCRVQTSPQLNHTVNQSNEPT